MTCKVRNWVLGACAVVGSGVIAANCAVAGSTPLTTERVAFGLTRPVYVTHAPGDFNRIFVVEQIGRIRVYDITQNPPALIGTFLDIQARVNDSGNEQGLLGMAFHPNYANNRFFYLNYTAAGGTTRVSRFSVPMGTPNAADPNSELIMLTVSQPESNHNGGWIEFGPADGYLYIALGDGGGANDQHGAIGNGQDMNALLGKMLRIDVDGNNGPGGLYGIPTNNPFFGAIPGRDEIWHVGLRNPWRNSFDRLTGDLYLADVGQNVWEEVNFQPGSSTGGENWGWRCREGAHNFNFQAHCSALTLLDPIHEYSHGGSPFRCSITGGELYRGCAIPDLQGTYFFADFCSNQIWSFTYTGSPFPTVTDRTAQLAPGGGLSITSISSFGRDAYGELYICDLNGGEVFRIIPNGVPSACNCDPMADSDGDSFNDCVDNCPNTTNALQSDVDVDGEGDLCDPCPAAANNVCQAGGTAAAEVEAAVGTMLSVADGTFSVLIEPDDLIQDGTLSVTRFEPTAALLDVDVDGVPSKAVQLSAFSVLFTPPAEFADMALIDFQWQNAAVTLPPNVNFALVAVAFFNTGDSRWKVITTGGTNNSCTLLECPPPGSGLDCASCTYATDHLSDWAVVGVLEPAETPEPAPGPHDRRKNRYISFAPNNPGRSVALRVTKTPPPSGSCWVTAPDAEGNSRCEASPTFRSWTEAVIHVGDCEIAPVASYEVTATLEGLIFAPPLTVETILEPSVNQKHWGDVVGSNNGTEWTPPNQVTNTQDVVALVAYIVDQEVKPTFQQVNLMGVSSDNPCLNDFVNTADVLIVVRAAAGDVYPFTTNPGSCGMCE